MTEIMNHNWLRPLRNGSNSSLTHVSRISILGRSPDEVILAAKLEAAGFNVSEILHAAHSNACNQLSALWHLLLEKSAPLNSPLIEKSFEINLEDADELIESTQRLPASSSQNPLLQIASLSKADPKQKSEGFTWTEDSLAFNIPSPTPIKIHSIRGHSRTKSEITSHTSGLGLNVNLVSKRSGVLLTSPYRLKANDITEEETE